MTVVVCLLAFLTSAQVTPDYTLGPDDVVTVTVLKHPEFSGDFLIPASGQIEVPAVGTVNAAGMGLGQLSEHIRTRLKTRLKKPEVTVTLKTARVIRVSVLGNVTRQGTVEYQPGWRLTEAISAAGGLITGVRPEDTRVVVLRGATERIEVSYLDATADRNGKNITVQPGDVITVETEELLSIYVVGKVKSPGLYKLRAVESTPVAAILAAGGLDEGAATNTVKVVHTSGAEETLNLTPVLIRGESVPQPRLKPGDLVVVPESTARVAVLGAVARPAYYAIPQDRTISLVEALTLAQGADPKVSRLSRVALVRTVEGKEQRKVYDVGRFFRNGDKKQNPEVKAGDVIYVPQTDRVEWSTVLSSLSTAAILFRVFQR